MSFLAPLETIDSLSVAEKASALSVMDAVLPVTNTPNLSADEVHLSAIVATTPIARSNAEASNVVDTGAIVVEYTPVNAAVSEGIPAPPSTIAEEEEAEDSGLFGWRPRGPPQPPTKAMPVQIHCTQCNKRTTPTRCSRCSKIGKCTKCNHCNKCPSASRGASSRRG